MHTWTPQEPVLLSCWLKAPSASLTRRQTDHTEGPSAPLLFPLLLPAYSDAAVSVRDSTLGNRKCTGQLCFSPFYSLPFIPALFLATLELIPKQVSSQDSADVSSLLHLSALCLDVISPSFFQIVPTSMLPALASVRHTGLDR